MTESKDNPSPAIPWGSNPLPRSLQGWLLRGAIREDDIALFLGRLWTGDGVLSNHQRLPPYYATSSRQLVISAARIG